MLTPIVLKEKCLYLKTKYRNKLQSLVLEHCTDVKGQYIYLVKIIIRKSQNNKGWGSIVMQDIINFANQHNVRIKIWVTNIYGSDLQRLYRFYLRLGFVLIIDFTDGHMMFYPKKIRNN